MPFILGTRMGCDKAGGADGSGIERLGAPRGTSTLCSHQQLQQQSFIESIRRGWQLSMNKLTSSDGLFPESSTAILSSST